MTWQVTASTGTLCMILPDAGAVLHREVLLERNGARFALHDNDPYWEVNASWDAYQGTLNGLSFTASNSGSETGCTHVRWQNTLDGSFSEDGNHFSATEVWRFTRDSGEVVTRTFSWVADRR